MKKQHLRGERENFLQRRYGVRLGRRYALAAASFVLLGVFGCPQIDNGQNMTSAAIASSLDANLSPENRQF
jgi:serpin B